MSRPPRVRNTDRVSDQALRFFAHEFDRVGIMSDTGKLGNGLIIRYKGFIHCTINTCENKNI